MTGRLFTHFKHEELKKQVQQIHDKEHETKKAKKTTIVQERFNNDMFEIDDSFKLPYGLGFDHVIKKKTDLINQQKFQNYKVMDELIHKLGYMDYRDALACNKYIIEAKRHGDYHQKARSKILQIAMAKYNAQKRLEIEQKAAQTPTTQMEKDEAKLNVIMNGDAEMAELYKEIYGDIKAEREFDENDANRIHNKYAYLYDGKTMSKKKESEKYELQNEKEKLDDYLTTDISDPELDLIYKRYKIK